MCGIVGAISQQDVTPLLLEGLARLEYRGYDSAGVALIGKAGKLQRIRRPGKVAELRQACQEAMPAGHLGIAHTRWATHGVPSEANAHPQMSGPVAVVHNGIIENHEALRAQLAGQGFCFESDTDTEVIAHQLNAELAITDDLVVAMRSLLGKLEGAYAIAVIHEDYPDRLMAARLGSNLVVGIGDGEHYVASDPQALRSVTSRFVFPDDGELVAVTRTDVTLFDLAEDVTGSAQPTPQPLAQRIVTLGEDHGAGDKGNYQHYMLKEIHEQPEAVARTLSGRITTKHVLPQAFGAGAAAVFAQVRAVRITACGSSYYAGLVAQYWFEQYAGVPCQVEIASELRYRPTVVSEGTLLVTLSQSGETADTLAALRNATDPNYIASLCLCNVPNSSLVRASDFSMMLEAGAEICVASTKAFMAQATDLLMLVAAVGRENALTEEGHNELVSALHQLPGLLNETLKLEPDIKRMAASFVDKHHALFLGRGIHYPIALEGALKLKELSYIHAEGYPAGELKHGPLALVDSDMPVVAVAPGDKLIDKLKSNLEEVRARGATLFIFADEHLVTKDANTTGAITEQPGVSVLAVPSCPPIISPMIYTIPVQLLAYHVAVMKGTDIDQPRNLAKSVTVE